MKKIKDKSDNLKTLVQVLIFLFVLSALALTGRYFMLNHVKAKGRTSVTVPQNIIRESSQPSEMVQSPEAQGSTGLENSKADFQSRLDQHETLGKSATGGVNVDSVLNDNMNSQEVPAQKTSPEAPSIELDRRHPEYNEKFEVLEMLPGDVLTQYYAVKVHHGFDVKLYFQTRITGKTKNLDEVLNLRVTDVTEGADQAVPVLDSTFRAADGQTIQTLLQAKGTGNTQKYYRIEVSLDSSTGNAYQAASLMADFKWFVTDEEYNALLNQKPIIPGIVPPGTSGGPNTGIFFDRACWGLFLGSALLLMILLAVKKRRGKGEFRDGI